MRSSEEEYVKYKKRYVKHLQFDPALQNLSKFLAVIVALTSTTDRVILSDLVLVLKNRSFEALSPVIRACQFPQHLF